MVMCIQLELFCLIGPDIEVWFKDLPDANKVVQRGVLCAHEFIQKKELALGQVHSIELPIRDSDIVYQLRLCRSSEYWYTLDVFAYRNIQMKLFDAHHPNPA